MEFYFLSFITTLLILPISFYFLTLLKNKVKQKHGNTKAPPQAAGAWPIIGHLHLLGSTTLPHKTFASMADKFGPIFTIKLGTHSALIVSNSEIAKECFTDKDTVFVSRPKLLATEVMGYNYAVFGMSPYGPYWREVRKITTLELLSNRRVELLSHIRVSEVKQSITELYNLFVKKPKTGCLGGANNKRFVEMTKWLEDLNLNIMVRMIAGKRYSGEENEDHEEAINSKRSIREFVRMFGAFVVSDVIPYTRWFDFGGCEKLMKKIAKDLDFILQRWLDEHKMKRGSGDVVIKKEEQDFMDVLLSILDGSTPVENHSSYDSDTIIKSTCLVALSAGIDTTTVTLIWALSLLLNNPDTLKKAQEELDRVIGKERQVQKSDINNLVYLQAIITETLRLYPAAPLLLPRESIEDCTLSDGYHIPKGTRLIVNAWKIQRDPRLWSEPNEFKPERFLTTHMNVDFRGQHFELIPFGSGRRSCPGISLAVQVTQLALASLLHGFDIEPVGNKPVDTSEIFGATINKATQLEVLISPRLSSDLYE